MKKVFTLIHIFAWLLLFVLFCWILFSEGHGDWLAISVMFFSGSCAVFYGHFILLTRFQKRKKHGEYWGGLTVLVLVSPFFLLLNRLGTMNTLEALADQYFTTLFSAVVFLLLLSWIARATENSFLNALRREIREKQAVQIELNYLKSQINPHFLFNTLNNIHALSYANSKYAPEAIMRLSSLMRYMFHDANAGAVTLQQEVDYLLDYISLQQLRYKNGPIADVQISGDMEQCQIAPLLFIHLVENAYKHSCAKLEAGDIKIGLAVTKEKVYFVVENPVGAEIVKKTGEPGGYGLENVKKRLALIYPDRHKLEITSSAKYFKLNLEIEYANLPVNER